MVDLRGTPTFLYDGQCGFCRTWANYWKELVGERVRFVAFQDDAAAQARFGEPALSAAAHIVETDGSACNGARAVFLMLGYGSMGYLWLVALHDRFRPFAWLADRVYGLISRHRTAAGRLTRFFWGRPHVSTFAASRWLFMRLLGVTYLAAFGSAAVQITGLVGAGGILPAAGFLNAVGEQFGLSALWRFPTLAWFGSGDGALQLLTIVGLLAAAAVVLDVALLPALIAAYVCMLSVVTIGQSFFGFQWDALLLEIGLLAVLFAPRKAQFFAANGASAAAAKAHELRTSGPVRVLFWIVLFKVTWGSGWVKLLSGDAAWQDLTALSYHHLTQPLPNPLSRLFASWPMALHQFGTLLTLLIEFLVPFLYFLPRRLRYVGGAVTVLFHVGLALTGNFAFYNLEVIALCTLLFDDAFYRGWFGGRVARWAGYAAPQSRQAERRANKAAARMAAEARKAAEAAAAQARTGLHRAWRVAKFGGLALLFGSNAAVIAAIGLNQPALFGLVPPPLAAAKAVNPYGVFAEMPTRRTGVIVQGSDDALNWKEYRFAYKPGDPRTAPRFAAPHAPRLDWQMWFLQFGPWRSHPWFFNLMLRLLQGSPEVTGLLAHDPFPEKPPRYIRAMHYEYRFTTREENMVDGATWVRVEIGEYFPATSLDTLLYALEKMER